MRYRLNKDQLLEELTLWNRFIKRKVHLIACGGTAMTLLGVKPSTKDVDFMVPNVDEYEYLIKMLQDLGYKQTTASGWQREMELFRYDIFRGNRIHTTELLTSPLEQGGNTLFKEFSHLYIGILNEYDLIASKLMRGTSVDFEDCLNLVQAHSGQINLQKLGDHFNELVNYDVSEDRIRPNMDIFLNLLKNEGLA
jgi:hypothetical protein